MNHPRTRSRTMLTAAEQRRSVSLKLGYGLTPKVRFTVGYDLIYWSRAVRPGGQIDTSINLTQLLPPAQQTGAPGPLFAFRESDLWIQGLSVGGELRF
jgi:Putative beta barrel porin-7 (BBP7)